MSTDSITWPSVKPDAQARIPLIYRRMLLYAAFGTTFALLILGMLICYWLWNVKDYGVTVDWDGRLLAVDPHSRAGRAGVQPGDTISFLDFQRLKQLSGQSQVGQLVDLTIRHQGVPRLVTLEAQPATLSQRLDREIIPLVGIGFILLGLAPLLARERTFALWMFFPATQVTGLFLMAERPRGLHLFWAEVITYTTLALFPAVLFHFHTLFPQDKFGRWRRPLVAAIYLWGACIIPFNLPSLWDWQYHTSDLEIAITEIYLSGVLLACLGLLVHTYRTTQNRRVRKQLKIITLCSGLGLALTPVLMVTALLVDLGVSATLENLSVMAAFTTPLGYAYAMLRHDLLLDGIMWRRWLMRVAMTSLLILAAGAAGALWLSGVAVNGGAAIILGVLITLGAVVVAIASTWATERLEDRVFKGRTHIDFLEYATAELERCHRLEDYVQFFAQALPARLKIRGAIVFLAPEQENQLKLYGASASLAMLSRTPDIQTLSLTGEFCAGMPARPRLISLTSLRRPQSPAFDPAETRFLDTLSRSSIELLMPLVSAQQPRLIGIVALGIKETDEDYSNQERTALTALARTAAASAENVLLFEAQKEERENSVALARYIDYLLKKASKEAARNIHDRPLQELAVLQRALSELREQIQIVLVQFLDLQLSLDANQPGIDPATLMRIKTVLEEGQRLLERVLGEDVRGIEPALAGADDALPAGNGPPPLESLSTIEGLIEQVDATTQQLREICNNMHPTYLHDPLVTTVRRSVERIRKQHPSIRIEPTIEGTERSPISDNVKMACKEVMDQAIRNAITHGKATDIQVQLAFASTGAIALRVADNGTGFTPEPPRRLRTKGHHGLANMAERAELAGGKLQIQSAPGQGAQIILTVPLPADTPASESEEPAPDSDGEGAPVLLST